ncbi:MAG TPA: peptidoglycan DD-metalloendopeptidase family protein [Gemmatimonadaceae bacterium]|nr:peptidoglycan DD-metalloendopeptidase family protein [Gemmatimonadaceae bacterium]
MKRVWSFALALCALGTLARPARAQDQSAKIRAQRDTLEQIRREREALERRAAELQNSVHDLNEEVTNLNSRADATARIVKTLDNQLASITADVNDAATKVALTEAELTSKRAALRGRLIDIYKRGPMATTEALLSARSFGELVARYKYLHMLALHDRALVNRVEQLREEAARERDQLVSLQQTLEESRADKAQEEDRLRALERERQSSLSSTRRQAQQIQTRVARLRATETQLTNAISTLDAERRRAERARPSTARSSSSIKTSDYGKLDWPVDGPLVYTFGKTQTASNTTIRWNGVGIRAPINTSVHAVAAGKVVRVGPLGTYGLTVIIDHGGGDYSIYGSLSRADVREQETVRKGQVIGGVGISDPDLPPHLHFEIRHGGNGGAPAAVDPARWLRGER